MAGEAKHFSPSQEVLPFDNGRRHVGDPTSGAPGDVGLDDIARAVRANGEDVLVGETTSDKDQPARVAVNRRGDELPSRAVDHPEAAAVVWIVTGHATIA